MSATLPEVEPVPGGRMPLTPVQILGIVALCLLAFGIVYFMVSASGVTRKSQPIKVEKVDNEHASPFVGAPAEPAKPQEVAAKPMPTNTPVGNSDGGLTPDQRALQAPLVYQGYKPVQGSTSRPSTGEPAGVGRRDEEGALEASLHTSVLAPARAHVVRDPTHTIPMGTLIPCVQQTAIDTSSGMPALVTAVIPVNVWGPDHKVILIDRGSTVVGEIGHGLVNGLDRLGVVWKQLQGPGYAYEINLDSPAAGPLGESGLDGDVNRHEWQKIKGVLLLSLIQGGIQAGTAAASGHGSNNSLNFYQFQSGGQEVANTLLQSQIQIPDTIHRDQGLTCSIFVARALNFGDVWTERAR